VSWSSSTSFCHLTSPRRSPRRYSHPLTLSTIRKGGSGGGGFFSSGFGARVAVVAVRGTAAAVGAGAWTVRAGYWWWSALTGSCTRAMLLTAWRCNMAKMKVVKVDHSTWSTLLLTWHTKVTRVREVYQFKVFDQLPSQPPSLRPPCRPARMLGCAMLICMSQCASTGTFSWTDIVHAFGLTSSCFCFFCFSSSNSPACSRIPSLAHLSSLLSPRVPFPYVGCMYSFGHPSKCDVC